MTTYMKRLFHHFSGPIADDIHGPLSTQESADIQVFYRRLRRASAALAIIGVALLPTPGTTVSWKESRLSGESFVVPSKSVRHTYRSLTLSDALSERPEIGIAPTGAQPLPLTLSADLGPYSKLLLEHNLAR